MPYQHPISGFVSHFLHPRLYSYQDFASISSCIASGYIRCSADSRRPTMCVTRQSFPVWLLHILVLSEIETIPSIIFESPTSNTLLLLSTLQLTRVTQSALESPCFSYDIQDLQDSSPACYASSRGGHIWYYFTQADKSVQAFGENIIALTEPVVACASIEFGNVVSFYFSVSLQLSSVFSSKDGREM